MTQVSYYEPRSASPRTLAIVIALHAAGITALALAKTEFIPTAYTELDTYDVPTVTPEKPPEPVDEPPVDLKEVKNVPVPIPVVDIPVIADTPIKVVEVDVGMPQVPWTIPGEIAAPVPPPPPAEQSAKARGNVQSLFSMADYPPAAMRRNETGTARARLAIGADGRVTGCTLVASTGSSSLDAATCRVLTKRARFTPARNSSGQPTTGSYVTPAISWQLVDG